MRPGAVWGVLARATPVRLVPCAVLLLSTGWVTAAAAQTSSATVEVTATVADVAGFHAIPDSAAPGVARTDAGLWRIAAGRGNEIAIVLDPVGRPGAPPPRIVVCSQDRGTSPTCRPRRLPSREACGPNRMLLLTPLEPATGSDGSAHPTPVRITVAYTAN
jgi:hypothetical protein